MGAAGAGAAGVGAAAGAGAAATPRPGLPATLPAVPGAPCPILVHTRGQEPLCVAAGQDEVATRWPQGAGVGKGSSRLHPGLEDLGVGAARDTKLGGELGGIT